MFDFIWAEKYRPTKIEDMILDEKIKNQFLFFIKNDEIPHILLLGKPGTGKTTLAKILVKNIDCDYIELNASDERGIDVIRGKIKEFAKTKTMKKIKIIFLDESDFLTNDAQGILRSIIETYARTTRFILTANYKNKLLEPIKSRFQIFEFESPDKQKIEKYIINLIEKEGVTSYDKDYIKKIVDDKYPDMRTIINYIQKSVVNNKLEVIDIKDDYKNMTKWLNEKNILSIRNFLNTSSVDYVELYRKLYEYYFNKKDISRQKKGEVLILISDYLYKHSLVADPEINFSTMCIDIIRRS